MTKEQQQHHSQTPIDTAGHFKPEYQHAGENRLPANGQDWFNYWARFGGTDYQLQAVLRFGGHLHEEVLARALRLSADAEPVLGCRFVEDASGGPYWERRTDLDELDWCGLRRVADDGTELEAAVQAWLSEPLNMDSDPMVKAALLRTGGGDTLCLKINHACSDGAGLKQYTALLARLYTELCADAAFRPEPPAAGDRSQQRLFAQLGLAGWQQAWDPEQAAIQPGRAFPYTDGEPLHRRQEIRRLSGAAWDALMRQAKAWGLSVNDMVLTAYSMALHEVLAPGEGEAFPVTVTADLRRHLPKEEAPPPVCNLSGAVTLLPELAPGVSFGGAARSISALTRQHKQGPLGMHTAAIYGYFESLGYPAAKDFMLGLYRSSRDNRAFTPMLSNFGLVSAEPLFFGSLPAADAYMVSPAMRAPGFMLGASGYAGVLTLTAAYFEPATEPQSVAGFMDRVQELLLAAGRGELELEEA